MPQAPEGDDAMRRDLSELLTALGLDRDDVERAREESVGAEQVLAGITAVPPLASNHNQTPRLRPPLKRTAFGAVIAASIAGLLAVVVPIVGPTTATADTPALLRFEGVKEGVLPRTGGNAQAVLERLADRAERQVQTSAGTIQFVKIDGWSSSSDEPTEAGSARSVLIPTHLDRYYFPNGTMRTVERRGNPLNDRGEVTEEKGNWSDNPSVADDTFDFSDPGPAFAGTLSTDPQELFQQLAGDPSECVASRASCVISPIVNLHSTYVLPPKVNAAVWRMLALEPDLTVLSTTRDRLGRPAIALTTRSEDPKFQEVILADPATGAWLGNETILVARSIDFDYSAPAVVEFNAIVVSKRIGKDDVP